MKAVAGFLQVMFYLAVAQAWTCTVPPQQYLAKQIDAGQGMVVLVDQLNQTYYLSGSAWIKLGTVNLIHVSVGLAGIWGVDGSNKVYKYVSGDFVLTQGLSLQQVDAGGLQVVGVTISNAAYCLKSILATIFSQIGILPWDSQSKSLTYYSCGPLYGCWGIDSDNRIYFTQLAPNTCAASDWVTVDGLAATKVEVGSDGNVFVLDTQGNVYQRTGISNTTPGGTSWTQIQTVAPVKHVTYDFGQLWLILENGIILKCTQ